MKSRNNIYLVFIFAAFLLVACKAKENSSNTSHTAIESKESFISLYRSGCFGTCPSYKVTINGDGSFLYFGRNYVDHLGSHIGVLSAENASLLFKDLKSYKWKSYPSEYPIDNVDFPQFNIEYSSGNTSKKIQANSKASKELIKLSERIDDLIKDLELKKLD